MKIKGTVEYCVRNEHGDIVDHGVTQNMITNIGLLWMTHKLYYAVDDRSFPVLKAEAPIWLRSAYGATAPYGSTAFPFVSPYFQYGYPDCTGINNADPGTITHMAVGGATSSSTQMSTTSLSYRLNGEYYGIQNYTTAKLSGASGAVSWTYKEVPYLSGATDAFYLRPITDANKQQVISSRKPVTVTNKHSSMCFESTWGRNDLRPSSGKLKVTEAALVTSPYLNEGVVLCRVNLLNSNIQKSYLDTLTLRWTIGISN